VAVVKEAQECRIPDSKSSLRLVLFEDGVIKCCSVNAAGQSRCCYTSPPDHSEDYQAWVGMLKNKGYETKELDKSSVVVPRTDYEALRERVNVSLHKIEVSLHGAMPAGQV
jgi:tRNA A37 threonylcarbamoyladenosine synthetase subunit TsaC/SUA5/YrdC